MIECFKFGVDGSALNWFASYLSDRTQRVRVNGGLSDVFAVEQDVPQGSCLGPLLLTIYTSNCKLFEIVSRHLPSIHCYADDTQLYLGGSAQTRQLLIVLYPEGRGTPLFGRYGDVPLDRAWFFASLS